MNVLEVRHAFKTFSSNYDSVKVFEDLNLSIIRGTIYCLVGSSGVGKTTLISCILGQSTLDLGQIEIFGRIVKLKDVRNFSHLIGFMPQDTGLAEVLTVRETLRYFAYIHDMPLNKFEEQYVLLKGVLNLPNDNVCVDSCSGGEKRRISLASAIIHEPKFIILDEPTVGMDALLRENVWKFLSDSVREHQVSILLTTHYIHEANYADHVGFMRNGRLLIEGPPQKILAHFEPVCATLDEIFLYACEKTAKNSEFSIKIMGNCEDQFDSTISNDWNIQMKPRKALSCGTLKALVYEEYIHFKREPIKSSLNILSIFASVIIHFYSIGNIPDNLNIGVVNDNYNCIESYPNINNSSCLLIDKIIDEKIINLVPYSSAEKAFKDTCSGVLKGVIVLPSNITEVLYNLIDFSTSNTIDVHLDHTEYHNTWFTRSSLLEAFKAFSEELNISLIPVNTEPLYGPIIIDVKRGTFIPMCFIGLLLLTSTYTSASVLCRRKNGTWLRTLASGATKLEMISAKFIFSCLIMLVTLIYFVIIIKVFNNYEIMDMIKFESMILLILIIGALLGIILGLTVNGDFLIAYCIVGFCLIQFLVGNLLWPIEAIDNPIIKTLAYLSPSALPSIAGNNMIIKGISFDFSIFIGYAVLFAWILGCVLTLYILVSRNPK